MALKSSIHKVELAVSDTDRGYYATHALTLARHPSETEARMMVRILAFALFADERLEFGRGLCADDEADLWLRELHGEVRRWIDVGQPDEKWVRKACARAASVVVLSYGAAAEVWWRGAASKLARFDKLEVLNLDAATVAEVAQMAGRNMRLQCTVQDAELWITDGERSVHVVPRRWQASRLV